MKRQVGEKLNIKSEETKYKTKDDEISCHIAWPEKDGKYPGVVLIHEIFGLDQHTKGVADRLAAEGYVVLAPHLFSSKRLSPVLTPESIGEAIKFMMSIPPEKQRDESYRAAELGKLDDARKRKIIDVYTTLFINRPTELFTDYLSYAVDHLNSLDKVNGKIGSVGFCFGGGLSINLACTGKTDGSIIFYGENPAPIDKIKDVKGAVMGIYAGEDGRINSKIDELVGALVRYKKSFSIKVYPGVHHAFFNDTRQMTYNKKAAEDAWRLVLGFFSETLNGG
jgi:carboxymethylenebutenolidase